MAIFDKTYIIHVEQLYKKKIRSSCQWAGSGLGACTAAVASVKCRVFCMYRGDELGTENEIME